VSCGVGLRHGSDLALLRLWHRPADIAPIRPLAWKPSNAMDVALKIQKKKLPSGYRGNISQHNKSHL